MFELTAVCKAIEAVCTFLSTPEGQALCKQWREDAQAFRADIQKAAKWLELQK